MWLSQGRVIEWMRAAELPHGGSRRGEWYVWSDGSQVQTAKRAYPEDAEGVKAEAPNIGGRDLERRQEAGAELNRDFESFLADGNSIQAAKAKNRRTHIQVEEIMILGAAVVMGGSAGGEGGEVEGPARGLPRINGGGGEVGGELGGMRGEPMGARGVGEPAAPAPKGSGEAAAPEAAEAGKAAPTGAEPGSGKSGAVVETAPEEGVEGEQTAEQEQGEKETQPQKKPGTTRTAVKRQNPKDWKKLKESWDEAGYGDILSEENKTRIESNKTPIVDDAWIKHFPGDAPLKAMPFG